MASTEPNEKHGSLPEVEYADLLRALTVERFTVWNPPESATNRAAPRDHARTETSLVNTLNDSNVRGRVHDGKSRSNPWRVR